MENPEPNFKCLYEPDLLGEDQSLKSLKCTANVQALKNRNNDLSLQNNNLTFELSNVNAHYDELLNQRYEDDELKEVNQQIHDQSLIEKTEEIEA